jgi:hypothetical protein
MRDAPLLTNHSPRRPGRRGFRGAAAGIAAAAWLLSAGAGEAPGEAPSGEALRVADQSPSVLIHAGKRLLLEYRYDKVPFKPYAKQLLTPSGLNVLLDAPHDHLHHHALMFAVGVDGVDFWAETPRCGKQVHRGLQVTKPLRRGGLATAGFAEQLDWLAPDGKLLLQEQRSIEAGPVPGAKATLVTWRSRLSCPGGKDSVKLTGSHYFGLGMRFLRSMDKMGTFRNAEGSPEKTGTNVRGAEYVAASAWCALTAQADGKGVTAAMFGHPGCQRYPVTWFTMASPFAYLSATMNLWKHPLTLTAKEPLELWYGVAVWDGQVAPAQIEKLRGLWVEWCSARKTPQPARDDER